MQHAWSRDKPILYGAFAIIPNTFTRQGDRYVLRPTSKAGEFNARVRVYFSNTRSKQPGELELLGREGILGGL